jgi:hypothetical protein
MIQPDEIRRKAENLYPKFLSAWLSAESYFPRTIPCAKELDVNLATASRSVQNLRAESKEVRGFGYSVEWEQKNSRSYGRNEFPRRIVFETPQDFLRLIGKENEFFVFADAVSKVRSRYPVLDAWVRSHAKELIGCAAELDGLLHVIDYFVAHPRPGVFARELPLNVDTKFIEYNEGILQSWLDIVLPPHEIRADEEHFHRRFGLRYSDPHLLIRFLDPQIQKESGCPWSECSVPLHAIANRPIIADRILIVENKVNLLTLPPIPRTLALGGLGNSVTDLRYAAWLPTTDVWYWGDIDVDGFMILSRLRSMFTNVQSLFMDEKTAFDWREPIATCGNGRRGQPPANLSLEETATFHLCSKENLRIEQERFPHSFVCSVLRTKFGKSEVD